MHRCWNSIPTLLISPILVTSQARVPETRPINKENLLKGIAFATNVSHLPRRVHQLL